MNVLDSDTDIIAISLRELAATTKPGRLTGEQRRSSGANDLDLAP